MWIRWGTRAMITADQLLRARAMAMGAPEYDDSDDSDDDEDEEGRDAASARPQMAG